MTNERINILVIGQGGREHALVWKLAQSPRAAKVYCAPGNAGTAADGKNVPISCDVHDLDRLVRFAKKEQVGLVVVGPEMPLAHGVVDMMKTAGLRVFGPTRDASRIEASKVFAKQLMRHADIPTAEFQTFDHPQHARTYVESRDEPLVVKPDGLTGGKGVFVCSTNAEALEAINRLMVREDYGTAGRQIVVERRLTGPELSAFAIVSGRSIVPLSTARDYKRLGDGDTGPNTGGMGAYSPSSHESPELTAKIDSTVFVPAIHAMRRKRTPFRGLLYAPLMVTPQGLRVLEFNARFGDPELECLVMRYRGDLLELIEAAVDDRLDEIAANGLDWDPRPAVSVVIACSGYPGTTPKGKRISGLDAAAALPDVKIFHAGTLLVANRIVTDGGRVFAVTAIGDTLKDARTKAYAAVERIEFPGMVFRRDIALTS